MPINIPITNVIDTYGASIVLLEPLLVGDCKKALECGKKRITN